MAFDFPVLSKQDIVINLSELFYLPVEESFFKKPDPGQWQKMLAHMLCVITECPEDTFLKQPFLSAEIEYLDLHQESMPLMHLLLVMQNVMSEIECRDFSAGDIFKPTQRKMERICSALINYARFKSMRLPDIQQIKLDTESEKENYLSLQKENEDLKQKINQMKAQRAEQEPELDKIKEEMEAVNVLVNEMMQGKTQVQKEITGIQTKVMDNIAKADDVKNQLLRRQNESEMLSQKIVQSPTKVQAEQDSLNQQVQMLKDTLERKRQRLRELNQLIENHEQCGASAEKGLAILEAINATVNKESEINKEINQLEDRMQDLQYQIKEVNKRKTKLQEITQSKQEKVARLSYQHQSRMNVLREQQEILKQDKELFMQKQDSTMAKKADLIQYKKKVEAEDRKEQRIVEEKTEKMKDLYSQLLNTSDACHANIGENWVKVRKVASQLNNPNV